MHIEKLDFVQLKFWMKNLDSVRFIEPTLELAIDNFSQYNQYAINSRFKKPYQSNTKKT